MLPHLRTSILQRKRYGCLLDGDQGVTLAEQSRPAIQLLRPPCSLFNFSYSLYYPYTPPQGFRDIYNQSSLISAAKIGKNKQFLDFSEFSLSESGIYFGSIASAGPLERISTVIHLVA